VAEPKTVRHHYVPRFYLEGFTAGDPSMLWVYDKDTGRRWKASTRDAGLETHYHSITRDDGTRDSETIESAFAEFESDSAPALRAIRAGELLSGDDRAQLAAFIAVQMTRVPLARRHTETIARMVGEAAARPILKAQLEGPPDQQWESTKLMLEELRALGLPALRVEDIMVEPKREIMLAGVISAPALAQLFYDMTWAILPAKGRHSFVTSDNPLVSGPASSSPGVGLASSNAVVVFPLSSTRCLFANWKHGRRQWNVPRSKVSEAMVVALNKRVIAGALRFVYSDQDSDGLGRLVERYRDSAPQIAFDGPETGRQPPVSF